MTKPRYLLWYEVDDYAEMGGGTHVEEFETKDDMHDRANELLSKNPDLLREAKNDLTPYYIGVEGFEIARRFAYKPVEIATKYLPVEEEEE